jgi:hypothetical protein
MMLLTRLSLYGTLGLLMSSMDFTVQTWQFWSIIALFWAAQTCATMELEQQLATHKTHQPDNNNDHRT